MADAITKELANMQNYTAQTVVSSGSNEMNQDMFLRLMLEQLKYQDPMNPMSNQEFLAQQAQFTQLNEMQKLNESITSNNTVQQCVSLIGKEVTMIDPDDTTKTITGVVTEAVFDANGSSIKVNDKNYPLGLVTSIRDVPKTAEVPADDTTDETAETGTTESAASAAAAMNDSISTIAKALQFVASNISKYLN